MRKIFSAILVAVSLLAFQQAYAQQIKGTVIQSLENGKSETIAGANVYWADKSHGTVTSSNGTFEIAFPPAGMPIITSFIGFRSDTLYPVAGKNKYEIRLVSSLTLSTYEVVENGANSHMQRMNPIATQEIGTGELQRAACCNLSESFETNASVDVSFTDAVSGAKQIQLLGLAGVYSQIMAENVPYLRGLGNAFGLDYIPGTWMESIQISKGTSAVLNGYESVTGQINVEFKKPESGEKLFFNAYGNDIGKMEYNFNARKQINKKLSTIVFGHYSFLNREVDHNHDDFMDVPKTSLLSIANNWKYQDDSGLEFRAGIRMMTEDRNAGQLSSLLSSAGPEGLYTMNVASNRVEGFLKTGFIFKKWPSTSLGIIQSYTIHNMDAIFGNRIYKAEQRSYYANMIFQSTFGNPKHAYNAGLSFTNDNLHETLSDTSWNNVEQVPGAFFQYTYNVPKKVTLIAGIRGDYNSRFGYLVTPRLHLRFNLFEETTLRLSAGKGYRTPHVIPENLYLIAGSRPIIFTGVDRIEKAYNVGINLTHYFHFLGNEGNISAEAYTTSFQDQLLLDTEADTANIIMFNLDGKSFSNSYQVELSYPINKYIEIRAAYRRTDVRFTFLDGSLKAKPLVNRYKGLFTIAYASRMKKWQADLTFQFNGPSTLPDRSVFPEQYQVLAESPSYIMINAQLTKNFKRWGVYVGAENLANFKQHHPIIGADEPFGNYFDPSVVWGPVMGRKIYAGLRVRFL